MSTSTEIRSYEQCVSDVLSSSPTPLTIGELQRRVSQMRPIGECSTLAVDRAVRRLYQAVATTSNRYGWLSSLLTNTTFRHPLIGKEAKKGFLMLDELEHALFFPNFFQTNRPQKRKVSVELMDGPILEASAYIEQRTWSLAFGEPFRDWVTQRGGQHHDAVIIHVVDAVKGRYLLRLQPREARDDEAIQERNLACALLAESIVASYQEAVHPVMPVHELSASLIAGGVYNDPVPPDDLHYVLHHYSVLRLDDEGYLLQDASVSTKHKVDSRDRNLDDSAAEAAMSLFGWQTGKSSTSDSVWDWLDVVDEVADEVTGSDEQFPGDDEACHAYQAYLDQYEMEGDLNPPLPHDEFHMLEAELEYLMALEVEFGWLLQEQEQRKIELASRLFLDPDSLIGGDMGPTDLDEPPYWEN